MGLYENGIDTRKAILSVCRTLFLEKGYKGTSMDEICREAHVNRGSVYYHFKDKENIRYEVFWELVIENLDQARQYGVEQELEFPCGMLLFWRQLGKEQGKCRFLLEYFGDYPTYSPKDNLSRTVTMISERLSLLPHAGAVGEKLIRASLYGTAMSLVRLTAVGEYAPDALFRQLYLVTNLLYGAVQAEIDDAWDRIKRTAGEY